MRLLLHTALLATAAIAAPAPHPDCGRGGYNSWGGDANTCAEVDTNRGRGAYNGWDEKSKISTNADPNTGRGAYNGLDGDSKKSADADPTGGRGAYNGWDEIAKKASSVDTNGGRGAYNEVEENSKRSANADGGRGAYNGWDGDSDDSSLAETNGGRGAYNGWDGDSKESSYADFGRRWHRGRDSQRGSCDLRNAVMPAAPIALPPPAAGLTLGHVAIGRGNQNYTCDLSNSTAVPVAAGAVATLFNVSCLAADMPELLSRLCPIALDLPIPSSSDTNSPIYQGMSGHHYFKDATTPYFDLDTGAHRYGTGAFKKGDSTPAPATAMAGPYNSGNGPVAWLRLDAKTTTDGQVFKEVYRLNTAGGQPPKTCEGMPAAFEVPYAAEYWLFQ